MLAKDVIEEARKNVPRYMDEGLLKKDNSRDPLILSTFKRNSEESLKVADNLFKNNLSSLWTIVCSYYSMYYIANAVLYNLGYKVAGKISHKVTSDALIVFVKNKLKEQLLEEYQEAKEEAEGLAGIKSEELLENFNRELGKRERFQYQTTEIIKRGKAETSLNRAKLFTLEMKKLLID